MSGSVGRRQDARKGILVTGKMHEVGNGMEWNEQEESMMDKRKEVRVV